ncbi:MAG: hypothetical protein ACYC3V_06450 [Chloroflexota bacterium]
MAEAEPNTEANPLDAQAMVASGVAESSASFLRPLGRGTPITIPKGATSPAAARMRCNGGRAKKGTVVDGMSWV